MVPREGGHAARPPTSSLPVKPVTPHIWQQLQSDGPKKVSVFENEIYGQAGPTPAGERDTIPSYQPLSARSARSSAGLSNESTAPPPAGMRPPSRLGVQRGPVTSKFVVPPLNLAALNPQTSHIPPIKEEKEAKSQPQAAYGRVAGAPLAAAAAAAARAHRPSGAPRASATPQPAVSTFKVPLSGLVGSTSSTQDEVAAAGPGQGAEGLRERYAAGQRPSTRLGRPLSSLGQQPRPSSSASRPGSALRRSHLPDFSGSYRSSDHNELLIKASAWIERPKTAAEPTNAAAAAAAAAAVPTSAATATPVPARQRPSAEATAAWVSACRTFVLTPNLRESASSGGSRPASAALAAKAAAAIIPGLSNYAAARRFLLAPGPLNEPLRCRVERRRTGLFGGAIHYAMVLEEGECVMLTARRHRKANGAAVFDVYVAPPAGAPPDAAPVAVARLSANFLGTEYILTGRGADEEGMNDSTVRYGFSEDGEGPEAARRRQRSTSGSSASALGKLAKGGEMGAIMYSPNIMGTKGPRKVVVVLPKLVPSGESAWELQPATMEDALAAKYRHGALDDCITLRNRPPRWNAALGAYCLHFGGRVTHASVKNVQMVAAEDQNRVVLQFGRVGGDSFSLDYQFPMTPLQAFAVALSALDPKLGCE